MQANFFTQGGYYRHRQQKRLVKILRVIYYDNPQEVYPEAPYYRCLVISFSASPLSLSAVEISESLHPEQYKRISPQKWHATALKYYQKAGKHLKKYLNK